MKRETLMGFRATACSVGLLSIAMAALLDSMAALSPLALLLWFSVSILLLLPFCIPQPRRFRFGIPAALLVLLACVNLLPWNSRKVFLGDFRRIEPGMTVAQVESVMSQYRKGTGWPLPDGKPGEFAPPDSLVYRHATSGDYDSDWGVVRFAEGRVVATEFMAD